MGLLLRPRKTWVQLPNGLLNFYLFVVFIPSVSFLFLDFLYQVRCSQAMEAFTPAFGTKFMRAVRSELCRTATQESCAIRRRYRASSRIVKEF
jgi:hypothetical protein